MSDYRLWWDEAQTEASKARVGSCSICKAATLNLPIQQGMMVRQIVMCPNCTFGKIPEKAAALRAEIARLPNPAHYGDEEAK